MHNLVIPTTVVDGFFDDPDAIRKLALKQEFFPDPENKWPGTRTKTLHSIDNVLFQHIHNKFFNLFYPNDANAYAYNATSFFQLVDSNYKAGWIHKDTNLITLIVYLNKNPNKESGTVIYSPKTEGHENPINGQQKESIYCGLMSEKDGEKYRLENNNRFQEEIIVKNKYNRLLAFDAAIPHGVEDFTNEEPRLTLISFITVLQSDIYPIINMHRT